MKRDIASNVLYWVSFWILIVTAILGVASLFMLLGSTSGLSAAQMLELQTCESRIAMFKIDAQTIDTQLQIVEEILPQVEGNLTQIANVLPDIIDCQRILNASLPGLMALNQEKKTETEQFDVEGCAEFNATINPKLDMTQDLLNALNVTLSVPENQPQTTLIQSGFAIMRTTTNSSFLNVTVRLEQVLLIEEFYLVQVYSQENLTIGVDGVSSSLTLTQFDPPITAGVAPVGTIPVYDVQSQKIYGYGNCSCGVVGRRFEENGDVTLLMAGELQVGDVVSFNEPVRMSIGFL